METVSFASAKAVFGQFNTDSENAVDQYGFYYPLEYSRNGTVRIKITARNFFRLYINGKFVLHGPARTAHGYQRVDEIDITDYLIHGTNHIAAEVMVYGNKCSLYGNYSNDCTLEDGLFIAEIVQGASVLSATGVSDWRVCKISARSPKGERISHCREVAEIYTINADFHSWKHGKGEFYSVVPIINEPVYLPHKALIPKLDENPFENLLDYGACRIDEDKKIKNKPRKAYIDLPYYKTLPEYPLEDFKRTVRVKGGVRVVPSDNGFKITNEGTQDPYVLLAASESYLGFINISATCEESGIIDIVHSEVLELDGTPNTTYNTVTRLHVEKGRVDFISMEPALARYVLVIFRGINNVTLHKLSIINDSYPDLKKTSFLSSSESVNRLYNAATKTLILNTKDIFMDCPDRERGGWLCDSLWTARAASLMLSDSLVEKEFLENFLLTPSEKMYKGFFPCVYPAHMDFISSVGITTWSFWLGLEFCEYVRRTGDIAFRDEHKARLEAFINGSKEFIGDSGLIENLPGLFIDWSLSNTDEHKYPISTAANALYAYMLIELGRLYSEHKWISLGESIRLILRDIILKDVEVEFLKYIPDAIYKHKNDKYYPKENCYSEAAMYTSLWSGLFNKDEAPLLMENVHNACGPLPKYPKNPNVGESQLFIGLCIRLDMLVRQGNINKMFEDMFEIYMPQLEEGPGTLWETCNLENNSRCHGFTAHAGVHLIRDVLGIGIPELNEKGEGEYKITITPNICGLRWAKGTHFTSFGIVSVGWRYNGICFELNVNIPKGIKYDIVLPREVRMLDRSNITINVEEV